MRYLIIWLIWMYRIIVPPQRRNTCLFRESCSIYVERVARDIGCIAALRAFVSRYHCCRPGYSFDIDTGNNKWQLVCSDGSRFFESEVAFHIIDEFSTIIAQTKLLREDESEAKLFSIK